MLERLDHGRHVFRTCWRNSFLKQYEKAATFLRLELVSNCVRDFKLKKSLRHWEAIRTKFQEVTDRFAGVQAEHLNVHGLIERQSHAHAYHFTSQGQKLSILLVPLRKRVYGLIAFGVLRHRPNPEHQPDSAFERAYHQVDQAIDEVVKLMAA